MEKLRALATEPQILVLLAKSCVMVTLAFLLTRTRLFPNLLRKRLTLGEQSIALVLFLFMGFAEVAITQQGKGVGLAESPLNLRIVAVSAAGLLAGPWIGAAIGLAVTALAVVYGLKAPGPIAISMVAAGFAGGWIHDWNASAASRPVAGFVVGFLASLLRDGLNASMGTVSQSTPWFIATAAVLQGLSVGLILLVIEQVRKQEAQSKALAMSEVRALRARMDPHFLFNSLNTLSALSQIDPATVPKAAARLGRFLRASLDQDERPFVSLQDELEVVDAYLEIEALRMGDRISIVKEVDPHLLLAQIPPFLIQPLVENAVLHGIQPMPGPGTIEITAGQSGSDLIVRVQDDGGGVDVHSIHALRESADGHVHALELLRRRLECLYGKNFEFDVISRPVGGTQASIRIRLVLPEPGPAPVVTGTREVVEVPSRVLSGEG